MISGQEFECISCELSVENAAQLDAWPTPVQLSFKQTKVTFTKTQCVST